MGLRKYNPAEDSNAVLDIWRACNLSDNSFIGAEYWEGLAGDFASSLASDDAETTVFEDRSGNIVGFCHVLDGVISGVYVEESRRGLGLGRQLIENAMASHPYLEGKAYVQNQGACMFCNHVGMSFMGIVMEPQTGMMQMHFEWKNPDAAKPKMKISGQMAEQLEEMRSQMGEKAFNKMMDKLQSGDFDE